MFANYSQINIHPWRRASSRLIIHVTAGRPRTLFPKVQRTQLYQVCGSVPLKVTNFTIPRQICVSDHCTHDFVRHRNIRPWRQTLHHHAMDSEKSASAQLCRKLVDTQHIVRSCLWKILGLLEHVRWQARNSNHVPTDSPSQLPSTLFTLLDTSFIFVVASS